MDEQLLQDLFDLTTEGAFSSFEEFKSFIETDGENAFNDIYELTIDGAFGSQDEYNTFISPLKKKDSSQSTVISPQENTQEINDNPSLYGPTTIKKDDNLNQLTITIAGEETKIPTTRGTTSAEIADKITEAINKARKKVNESRTSSKLNKKNDEDKPSYAAWRKDNPGGSVKEWKKDTGR